MGGALGRLIFNGVPLAHRKTGYPREGKGDMDMDLKWGGGLIEMCSNEVKGGETITTAAFILFSNDTRV